MSSCYTRRINDFTTVFVTVVPQEQDDTISVVRRLRKKSVNQETKERHSENDRGMTTVMIEKSSAFSEEEENERRRRMHEGLPAFPFSSFDCKNRKTSLECRRWWRGRWWNGWRDRKTAERTKKTWDEEIRVVKKESRISILCDSSCLTHKKSNLFHISLSETLVSKSQGKRDTTGNLFFQKKS